MPDPSLPVPSRAFASDNVAGASPQVLDAIAAAARGTADSYGTDACTHRVERRLAELFEHGVSVFLVTTGTAANALCLSVLTPPWGNIYCHREGHINVDECGAPAMYTDGAELVELDGPDARIDPAALAAACQRRDGDVHATQPACVSVTQATEAGSVYRLDELQAIGAVCRDAGLRLHMDGARFANALVALGASPAEMTWRAGVDALSFGATKNGVLAAEAIVLFDPALAESMAYRRKRGGHLLSKMRLLSAQIDAYLDADLWLRNARQANAMAQRLCHGLAELGVERLGTPQANILFCRLPDRLDAGLQAAGFRYYRERWGPGVVRFVTSFATTEADVDDLLGTARTLIG